MKVVAYARRGRGRTSISEQITQCEERARKQGHDVRRLLGHEITATAAEYPPKEALVGACQRGLIDAVVVGSLSALGPAMIGTIGQLDMAGTRVLVVGDDKNSGLDMGSREMQLAVEVAKAVYSECGPQNKRECPSRVPLDLAEVRALREHATLAEISEALSVSRSTLCRRLKKDRERRARRCAE